MQEARKRMLAERYQVIEEKETEGERFYRLMNTPDAWERIE
jgi:hypothetical protein